MIPSHSRLYRPIMGNRYNRDNVSFDHIWPAILNGLFECFFEIHLLLIPILDRQSPLQSKNSICLAKFKNLVAGFDAACQGIRFAVEAASGLWVAWPPAPPLSPSLSDWRLYCRRCIPQVQNVPVTLVHHSKYCGVGSQLLSPSLPPLPRSPPCTLRPCIHQPRATGLDRSVSQLGGQLYS